MLFQTLPFLLEGPEMRARLMLDEDAHVLRRAAQYERLRAPAGALAAARACVFGKLENMARLLLRRGRKGAGLGQTAKAVREMAVRTAEMKNLDALRGLEGLRTRRHFSRIAWPGPPGGTRTGISRISSRRGWWKTIDGSRRAEGWKPGVSMKLRRGCPGCSARIGSMAN